MAAKKSVNFEIEFWQIVYIKGDKSMINHIKTIMNHRNGDLFAPLRYTQPF